MNSCAEILLSLVRQEAQVALGCTEPAMVSLAAARAREIAGEPPVSINVAVSSAVAKNAQAVGLPGTLRKGIDVAAALGALAGRPELGLEVLKEATAKDEARAVALVDSGRVRVQREPGAAGLYCRVDLVTSHHVASVTITGSHTNMTQAALDGRQVDPGDAGRDDDPEDHPRRLVEDLARFSFGEVYEAVMSADPDALGYLVDGARNNRDLAVATLEGTCREAAAGFVRSLRQAAGSGLFGGDLVTRVRLTTAAAVSARMGGTAWSVLTSGGSGNQGILVSVPVLLVAEAVPSPLPPGHLARALLLSHAVNLFLKAFTGELSAVCGAVTGGAGVAGAVTWLLGGARPEVEKAVEMVIGGLYAILCDGAKGSCAVKMAEGAANGVMAGQLALAGGFLEPGEGLVGKSLDDTARHLGRLTRAVINQADDLMTGEA